MAKERSDPLRLGGKAPSCWSSHLKSLDPTAGPDPVAGAGQELAPTRSRPNAPGRLRATAPIPSTAMRAAVTGAPTIGLMAAACFAAALPYGAEAQAAAPVDLPGLEVEFPTPADGAGVTGAGARAAVDATAPAAGAGGGPTLAAGANPYADPSAPWKVDASANSMPRQPLVDTPRTVTAIPKEVLAAKNATSICALAVSWRAAPRA
jgi:hypothetical protein